MGAARKVIWAPSAFKDLQEIADFIAAEKPKAAGEWAQKVLNRVEKLSDFPKLGRAIPELGETRYREIVIGNYRIFHEITEKEVLIFRILHTRRLFSL